MKKTILFATILLAATYSFGVSVQWKSGALSFGGVDLKNNTSVLGYLVYLESGTLNSSYAVDNTFSAAKVGTVVSTDSNGTAKGAQLGETFQFDFGAYENGDKFALVVSYNDGTKTYWNLSSDLNTLAGVTDPTSNPTAWNTYSAATSAGTDGTLTAGGGWVAAAAVPEPATGALALAGIALLLKRRKAAKA